MTTRGGWVSKSDFGLGWFLWTFFVSPCIQFVFTSVVVLQFIHRACILSYLLECAVMIGFMFPVSGVDPSSWA